MFSMVVTAGVPGTDRLVKGRGVLEHVCHVDHRRGVPSSNVFIEVRVIIEQFSHAGHLRHIPALNRAVCVDVSRILP